MCIPTTEVMKNLIEHYGGIENWESQHKKHYYTYQRIYFEHSLANQGVTVGMIDKAFELGRLTCEKKRQIERIINRRKVEFMQLFDDYKTRSEEEVIRSESLEADHQLIDDVVIEIQLLEEYGKHYIKSFEENCLEQIQSETIKRGKGAPPIRSEIFSFMAYLTKSLGSINAAANYVLQCPYIDLKGRDGEEMEKDSLLRQYRNHRNKDKNKEQSV